MNNRPKGPSTRAVHGGGSPIDDGVPPDTVFMGSVFPFDDAADAARRFEEGEGYVYSRWANPTVAELERAIADLEGAEACVAFASGMGAIYGVLATVLGPGDHVVAPRAIYAETAKVLRLHFARFGIETTFVDMTDLGAVEKAITSRTRLLWVETPANPVLAVTDLGAVVSLGRANDVCIVSDNTFATPYHQNPLVHGVDLVVHSATKGICGHGDALGGVVAGARDRVDAIREEALRGAGAVMAPMTAWLVRRGLRTMAIRCAQSSATAQDLATRLSHREGVARVYYPGLASHPGHGIAARQMVRGFGSMIAFELQGGADQGRRVHDRLALFTRAVSLGDVRSLVTHAASTTHHSMPREQRIEAGISDGLLRLSIGIEDVEDLWSDLDQALA
ncbi:MAG: PLP-dependent transferase [Myxococcales bacterium]|nr:PLP-dependent transferase [Myxococcales bacterium]